MTQIISAEAMRILTVRQPWAWAIIHGGKNVENRSTNLSGSYQGPVAIHVSQTEDVNAFVSSPSWKALGQAADREDSHAWWRAHGHIIGVVDLVGAHRANGSNPGELNLCAAFGLCSEWAEPGVWHLELTNPRPLAEPIAYRGGQGLRRLPADVIDAVAAQVTL